VYDCMYVALAARLTAVDHRQTTSRGGAEEVSRRRAVTSNTSDLEHESHDRDEFVKLR